MIVGELWAKYIDYTTDDIADMLSALIAKALPIEHVAYVAMSIASSILMELMIREYVSGCDHHVCLS